MSTQFQAGESFPINISLICLSPVTKVCFVSAIGCRHQAKRNGESLHCFCSLWDISPHPSTNQQLSKSPPHAKPGLLTLDCCLPPSGLKPSFPVWFPFTPSDSAVPPHTTMAGSFLQLCSVAFHVVNVIHLDATGAKDPHIVPPSTLTGFLSFTHHLYLPHGPITHNA